MSGRISSTSISAVLALAVCGGCARHYRAQGMVLQVQPDRRTLVVAHREIRGYMPAMAMPFLVDGAVDLRSVEPGARVAFELVVRKHRTVARNVKVLTTASEFPLPAPAEKLSIGDPVPDFALYDQLARPVHLSDFRGKTVAIDFIYTRCPLPEVCPRLSANFARLQRQFRGREVVLLSVSLDPQYDTPEVLTAYASIWRADPAIWRFLTGPVAEVKTVASRFGLVYWAEEGLLTHTSQTCVIGRDGRLAGRVEGSYYDAGQLEQLIALELEASR